MADYGSSRTRTQVSWPAAWISFWNSEGCWSSVSLCQMCSEVFVILCTLLGAPTRWAYLSRGTYILEDKQETYPTYCLNYVIWLAKLSNISLGSLNVPSARILLSVPGAYFHSWILSYKWHVNSTSFLHSFQFDNSDMKTFAKDKCKVKGSEEKYYIGSPWRIFFSLIGVQSVVSDWEAEQKRSWPHTQVSQARPVGRRSSLSLQDCPYRAGRGQDCPDKAGWACSNFSVQLYKERSYPNDLSTKSLFKQTNNSKL